MLQPARRKYRKEHKGRNTGVATRGNSVDFGEFGLKATDRGRITASAADVFGFVSSLTSPFPTNLLKCGWGMVKVTSSTMWLKFSQAKCFMKSPVCQKSLHARPFA